MVMWVQMAERGERGDVGVVLAVKLRWVRGCKKREKKEEARSYELPKILLVFPSFSEWKA